MANHTSTSLNPKTLTYLNNILLILAVKSIVILKHPCTVNTILSTCDITSLHTNITHDVFYKAIEYWIDKFHDDIPLLSRFTKAFILEGINIILKFNYFYIDENVFHQIKGTPMGTIFAVVGSNLTVAYFEVKMFALLP